MQYVIRKDEAQKIDEHGISVFSEYPVPFSDFSLGVSELKGRYPKSGFDIDSAIDQAWYVLSGKGTIGVNDQTISVAEGDLITIPKATKFFIDGQVTLVVVSSPPWTESQHQHVET